MLLYFPLKSWKSSALLLLLRSSGWVTEDKFLYTACAWRTGLKKRMRGLEIMMDGFETANADCLG